MRGGSQCVPVLTAFLLSAPSNSLWPEAEVALATCTRNPPGPPSPCPGARRAAPPIAARVQKGNLGAGPAFHRLPCSGPCGAQQVCGWWFSDSSAPHCPVLQSCLQSEEPQAMWPTLRGPTCVGRAVASTQWDGANPRHCSHGAALAPQDSQVPLTWRPETKVSLHPG